MNLTPEFYGGWFAWLRIIEIGYKKIIAKIETEKAKKAQLAFDLDESFKVLKKKFECA